MEQKWEMQMGTWASRGTCSIGGKCQAGAGIGLDGLKHERTLEAIEDVRVSFLEGQCPGRQCLSWETGSLLWTS